MFTTEKILEQFDDAGVLGRVLYASPDSLRNEKGYLYEDRECTNAVDKDTMYSLFLKGVYVKFLNPDVEQDAESVARPFCCAKSSDFAMMRVTTSLVKAITFYSREHSLA